MFNYETSTDAELLAHIEKSSSAAVSVAKKYHTDKGNFKVVARIDTARKVLRQQRVRAQLEKLEVDTKEFGRD